MLCSQAHFDARLETRVAAIPDAVAAEAYPPVGDVIETDGGQVHVHQSGVSGSGSPPVILIHGANGNLRDWLAGPAPTLARRRHVIAMDRPGFGYSTRETGRWTPARQAARLRAAADAIGAEKPLVIGHSWGAAVALAWALDAPDDISGVVCVSGATMPWGRAGDIASTLGLTRFGSALYTERLSKRAEDGSIEAFIARAFTPQRPPEGYLEQVGALLALRTGSLLANYADLSGTHRYLAKQSRRYANLQVPVEIIHGDADWLLGSAHQATRLAQRLPMARLTVARGVGHMAHHARPDLLEAAIDRIADLAPLRAASNE